MYAYLWEYEVEPEDVEEFARLYGPEGEWVSLFRQSKGYVRTELLHDRDDVRLLITVDYWESQAAWNEWRTHVDTAYQELEEKGAALTVGEREIGRFAATL